MVELAVAPTDDGSSTESEYYMDSAEEAEGEETACTLAPVKQEPQPCRKEDNLECNSSRLELKERGKILLPQGSEWSHGVTSIVSDNAVERALAMVRELRKATQQDEVLTTDTTNSNALLSEKKTTIEKKVEKTVILKKRKKERVKKESVSLKRAKTTTSPDLVAKRLRCSLINVAGKPSEKERRLAGTRSQWKSAESQTRFKATEFEKGPLPLQNQSKHRETKPEIVASSRRTERSNSVASQRNTHNRSPSICRSKCSNLSTSRSVERESRTKRDTPPLTRRQNCSNSPTSRPVDQESRTKRDTSSVIHYLRRRPVIQYSTRSRSRSPPNRRFEELRTRSRSSCRAITASSPRSRLHRVGENVPSRQDHDSQKQPSYTHKRSQSFSRYPRSVQATRGDRNRHDRHESRYNHYDSHELKSTQQLSGEKSVDRRYPSHRESARIGRGAQETNRETFQLRSRACHRSNSVHEREKLIARRRDDCTFGNQMMEEAEIPIAALATHDFQKQKSNGQTTFHVLSAPTASQSTKRSPHIRSRVNASAHDAFELQIFKLKIREADIDEMMAAGPCDEFNKWFFDNRKRALAEIRARLMAQDLQRFEKIYASLNVTPFQLKRYQSDRDFGWRVVQFKRKQASLQEQNDLLMSSERKAVWWRRLDKEREKLIAENATLFDAVMASQDRTCKQIKRKAFGTGANTLQSS